MDEVKMLLERNRAVWNLIAKWLRENELVGGYTTIYVGDLKHMAMHTLYPGDEKILKRHGDCYLCLIAKNDCRVCPGTMDKSKAGCLDGLYTDFTMSLMAWQDPSLSELERSNARNTAIQKAEAIANIGFEEESK